MHRVNAIAANATAGFLNIRFRRNRLQSLVVSSCHLTSRNLLSGKVSRGVQGRLASRDASDCESNIPSSNEDTSGKNRESWGAKCARERAPATAAGIARLR